MNFVEHYFLEKKTKKKTKRKPKGTKFSMASYFNSKNYDKGLSGTLDLNLVGETLNTKVNVKWDKLPLGLGQLGYFNIDEKDYEISFTSKKGELNKDIYEILFWQAESKNKDEFGIVGNVENPLKVFGAISNIIQNWIQENNPTAFYFSAKEPSRIQLYNRFAKLIERQTDYHFDEELNDEVSNFYQDDYEEAFRYYSFSK